MHQLEYLIALNSYPCYPYINTKVILSAMGLWMPYPQILAHEMDLKPQVLYLQYRNTSIAHNIWLNLTPDNCWAGIAHYYHYTPPLPLKLGVQGLFDHTLTWYILKAQRYTKTLDAGQRKQAIQQSWYENYMKGICLLGDYYALSDYMINNPCIPKWHILIYGIFWWYKQKSCINLLYDISNKSPALQNQGKIIGYQQLFFYNMIADIFLISHICFQYLLSKPPTCPIFWTGHCLYLPCQYASGSNQAYVFVVLYRQWNIHILKKICLTYEKFVRQGQTYIIIPHNLLVLKKKQAYPQNPQSTRTSISVSIIPLALPMHPNIALGGKCAIWDAGPCWDIEDAISRAKALIFLIQYTIHKDLHANFTIGYKGQGIFEDYALKSGWILSLAFSIIIS